MNPLHVGLCEDDDELRGIVRDAFEEEGMRVTAVAYGKDAVGRFGTEPVDVIALDIGLPDSDGRDVCQALRARGVATPVVFLTARDALPDRLSGFRAGGDDYLAKPFAVAELVERVRALARRASPIATALAGLSFDPAAHAVTGPAGRASLTPTEFRLLARLAARPGEVVRRATLVAAAWPDGAIVHDNTVDTYVARIRAKLRVVQAAEAVHTARGVGYRLQ